MPTPQPPDLDSLYISEVEDAQGPAKLLHAEPLYIDLIRDLGARRGEKEWNLGFGLTDNLGYDTYQFLVEYEWAPIDRLGLEVEVPVTIFANQRDAREVVRPNDRVESLKTAIQWTFLVSEKAKTSLAIGYINEMLFPDLGSSDPMVTGNIFNPFLVAAKRWGDNFHTLLYTGPHLEYALSNGHLHHRYDANTSFHYMIPNTRNFVGVEMNASITASDFDMTMRPQMRLGIAENFLVGIVTGIPLDRENERFSMFTRLIWEPKHHKKHP
ncbi:MAG: phosphoribosylformylglycinamidine synthase [Flavobacteriales bacterium]|nr:phosphoribosylformylglycinamidine synthase [Flavobacteriales bacterium]